MSNNNNAIVFDVLNKTGMKLGQISLEEGYDARDVQFAIWDLGVAAAKYMTKLVKRDSTPGSLAMDVYVKGTRTPSFGLKQNLSNVQFGNVANLYKLENV